MWWLTIVLLPFSCYSLQFIGMAYSGSKALKSIIKANALSEMNDFFLVFGMSLIGGNNPKFMFMGWNSFMLPSVMYLINAPIAVSAGGTIGLASIETLAAFIPASMPIAADST